MNNFPWFNHETRLLLSASALSLFRQSVTKAVCELTERLSKTEKEKERARRSRFSEGPQEYGMTRQDLARIHGFSHNSALMDVMAD